MSLTTARRIYLISCAIMVTTYVVAPTLQAVAIGVLGTLSIAAIAFGVGQQRPHRHRAWLLIATAIGLLTIGGVELTALVARTSGPHTFPHAADFFILAAYVPLVLGLVDLGRPREASRNWELLLDAIGLSVAGSLVVWIALVRPAVVNVNATGKLVAVASWVGYMAVFGCGVRVALVWRTNLALNLVVAGTASFLVAKFLYAESLVAGVWNNVGLAGIGFAGFVVLPGAAALTTSMRMLSSDEDQTQELGTGRLAIVATALLIAPTVLLVEATAGPVTTGVVIAICGVVVTLIIVLRLWISARAHRRQAGREKATTVATRSLVEATTNAEVLAALRTALAAMVPPRSTGTVELGPTKAGWAEPHADHGAGAQLVVPLVRVVLPPMSENQQPTLNQVVFTAPANELAELRPGLTALSDQAGAALDRIELMRRLRAEERERYFRTLVLTSTDATLITRGGRIDYATPSARTMFGRDIRGERFDDVVRRSAPGVPEDRRPWSNDEDSVEGHIDVDGGDTAVLVHRRDLSTDPTVSGVVSTLRDVTAEQELRRDLAYRASHDALTGLPNAQAFDDELRGDEAAARGEGAPVAERRGSPGAGRAALFLDLDDFKSVNDTYGHQVGDQLLAEVAHRITSCLREEDLAARLGGDEFAILLRDVADENAAHSIAQRIVDMLAEPLTVGDIPLSSRASVGLAYTPRHSDLNTLLRNADTALYNAKARGKGRWWQYRDGMTNPTRRNVDLRHQLKAALDHGRLTVHYQPIVELSTGVTVGVEALIRSDDPRLMPPEQLIAVAEETGLISRVGEFVLHRALADAALWERAVIVSVNVSARQLHLPGFSNMVNSQLAASGADPATLVLEITENVPVDDDRAWYDLMGLRERGVRIAIDDYGTGYSSLSYLRQPVFDIVKIDQSFVDDVTTDRGMTLLRAVTSLCAELGLEAVAEGVRDAETRDALSAAGCPFGQGYFFSPALPFNEAARWIAERSR